MVMVDLGVHLAWVGVQGGLDALGVPGVCCRL